MGLILSKISSCLLTEKEKDIHVHDNKQWFICSNCCTAKKKDGEEIEDSLTF